MPIFTPPGTSSVEPSISLSYNSQASTGIAGFGWNITGLSAITRAGRDRYHNGTSSPVSYTALYDAFYLDGVRLNPISGNNGADGTVYATESETFSTITSITNISADNPDWFKVVAKDGSIMEFGKTPDARFLTDNQVPNVIMWRLNKMTDINGNYIEFKYETINRNSRVTQILYTGNTNTGLQPFNQINFSYSIKADRNTSFEAGATVNADYLLDKITVLHTNDANQTETVKTYKLNYGFDNIHSMLKEIVEFGGDETSSSLNSTILLYGDAQVSLVRNTTDQLNGTYDYSTGDFNGDGKTDLLQTSKYWNNDIRSFINTGFGLLNYIDDVMNGYGPGLMYMKALPQNNTTIQTITVAKLFNFLAADYDGDGRDDVIEVKSSAESYNECNTYATINYKRKIEGVSINYTKSFNPNTGYTNYTTQNFPYPSYWGFLPFQYINDNGNFYIPGDFDGDGNQDYILITAYRNTTSSCLTNAGFVPIYNYFYKAFYTSPSTGIINEEIINFGVGSNPYGIDYYARTIAEASSLNVFDFDGDGKMDILVTKAGTAYVLGINELSPSTGYLYGGIVKNTTAEITSDSKVFFGDFNGDKKTDILVRNANATWKTLYSTGLTFETLPFYFNNSVNLTNQKILVADFNGDGLSDVAHAFNVGSSTGKVSLYYSKGFLGAGSFYNEQYNYGTIFNYPQGITTGDFNGDGRADIMNPVGSGGNGFIDFITIKPFGQERLLQKVTNGHNVTTSYTYKLLTDKTTYPYFYDRNISLDDPANANPYNFVQLPMYALASLTVPNAVGGNNTTSYKYENALLNRAGKGFMGFKKVTSYNNVSNITSVTENDFNYQFATQYAVRQTTSLNNNLLSENIITNNFTNLSTWYLDKRYLQTVTKTLSIDYLNGKASETINSYDNFANVVSNISKVGTLNGNTVNPVETSTTTTSFGIHNTPVPSVPENITVTNQRSGMPAITATTTFAYNAIGLPITKTTFAGLPKAVTTSYTYDVYGNQNLVTVSSTGLSNRVVKTVFDAKGRYALEKEIGFGTPIAQKETFIIDSKWGTPLSTTTSDCLTSTAAYNSFGKLIQTNMPDGNVISYNDYWSYGAFLFTSSLSYAFGKPPIRVYYDKYGKELKTDKASFYNVDEELQKFHTVLTSYDYRGNVFKKSNSFFWMSDEPALFTTNTYDVYNRLINSNTYMGNTSISYANLNNGNFKVTSTSPSGQVTSKTTDPTGKIISATDAGGTLTFSYDSRGNQLDTKHGNITMVSSVYDQYGKQISLTDKNAGTTTYDYNAYGELENQIDAKGNTFNMTYDEMGRILTKLGTGGANAYYEYYNVNGCSNNNLSKITNGAANPIVKELTYDYLNRVNAVKQTVNATDYTTQYYYNTTNQLTTVVYPSNNKIINIYDQYGFLIAKNARTSSGKRSIFRNGVIDGEGRYKSYILLNGLTTTKIYNNDFPASTSTPNIQNLTYNFQPSSGNLLQRTDNINNQTETFTYDNIRRLTSSTVNGVQQFGVTYDGNGGTSLGNIATKTDAGYYTYRTDKINAVAYTMDNPSNGQNAVYPTPVSVMPHAEQVVTYNSLLKPAIITEDGNTLVFEYGPDGERVKTVLTENFGNTETRLLLGDYEVQISASGTREIEYIDGGDGLAAIFVKQNGETKAYAAYSDYLGSITTLTDIYGTITAQQNFDAWGRKRLPNNWNSYYATANDEITAVPEWLYRGYTGHEMLTLFTLINMNGRMYDPVLGRMLSPDNYVGSPYETQGYNRYSYANNNPLMYTDPDGNFIHLIVGAAIGAAVNLVVGVISGNINNLGDAFKAIGMGAIQGALGAAIGYGGFGWGAAGNALKDGFFTTASILGGIGTGIASSFLPSIPFGDNFSISPAFAFGSRGLSAGLTANARFGKFNASAGFSNTGNNSRYSYGGGYGGFSYYRNHFTGDNPQITGTFAFRNDKFNVSWENDLFGISGEGAKDRWRTNGIGFGGTFDGGQSFSFGTTLMTGEDNNTGKVNYPNEYRENPNSIRREGLFYFSYSNGKGNTFSAGINNERWRYGFHKAVHSFTGDGVFSNLRSSFPTTGYFRYGNSNPFTFFY